MLLSEAFASDAPFFFKLMNSPNWIEFIGDRNITSEKLACDYIENSLITSYEENGFGLYKMALLDTGAPIGICGLVKRDYLDDPDLGFAILPEHERNGYVFESAKACIAYGQNTLKLETILAITSHDNLRSRNVLLKIGFQETGTITPPNKNEELLLFSN